MIDRPLRSRLDAFHGRDPDKALSVVRSRRHRLVTRHDFEILNGALRVEERAKS